MANRAPPQEKKEYHQFYTPPPVRSSVVKNVANEKNKTTAATERKTSVVILNTRKLQVARLMTFSRLQQAKLKTRLKILTFRQQISAQGNIRVAQSMDAGIRDVVTASGLENPDHMGWLVEQSSSERRWCVVADMLFCVFENDFCETPVQVFVLPGYEVKNLVYNSAKRTDLSEEDKGTGRTSLDTVTVSGMLRYQFVLKDKVTGKTHAFGMNNKTDLEIWMSVLRNAVHLDINLFGDSDSEDQDTYQSSQTSIPSVKRSSSTNASSLSERSTKEDSVATRPVHISETSLNSSQHITMNENATTANVQSEPLMNHVNNNIKKNDLTSRSYDSFDIMHYIPSHRTSDRRKLNVTSGSLAETSQNMRAFTKVTRSHSCKDVLNRGHSIEGETPTDKKGDKKTLRKLNSVDDFRNKLRKQSKTVNNKLNKVHKMHSSNNLEISSDFKLLDENGKPRTWSGPKLGASHSNVGGEEGDEDNIQMAPQKSHKVRKSNSLKEFLLSGKSSTDETDCTQSTSVHNTDVEGYLQHKQLLKWTRLWCKVCDKHLYGFKSQESSSSTPELSLYLPDCSLALVSSDKGRRIYTFKVCQPGIRSSYFSADKLDDYCQWLDVLKVATNTMDLFRRRSSLQDSEMGKSDNKSAGFRRQLRREISGSSTISSDSLASNGSAKSTSSLTSYIKNHMKNLKSSKSTKTGFSNEQISISNFSSVDLLNPIHQGKPSTEKVKQRLKDQRKYSMPNLSYTAIMEQAKEACIHSKSAVAQRRKSTSASPGNLQNYYSSKTSRFTAQESFAEGEEPPEIAPKVNAVPGSVKQSVTKTDDISSNGEVDKQIKLISSSSMNSTPECIPHKKEDQLDSSTGESKPLTCTEDISRASNHENSDRSSIFNTHLPGPNNEGLLLVRDDITEDPKFQKPILGHRRVNSDGTVSVVQSQPDQGGEWRGGQRRQPVCVGVAARELHSPHIQGYLDTLMGEQDEWVNIWGVLKEDALYVYSSPIDEQTMDVLDVREWEVSTAEKMSSRDHVLSFKHPKFEPQYFSSESPSDIEEWRNQLQNMSRKDLLYEKDVAKCTAVEIEEDPKMEGEDLETQKSELLKYLLSQRKQALKCIQDRRSLIHDSSSQDTDLSSEANDKRDNADFIMVDDDQNWKDMTQLMQRKVSMQLKVDNIQKHLQIQRQGRKAKVTQQKKKFKLPISFSKGSSKSGVSGLSESAEDRANSVLRSPEQQQQLKIQVDDLNTRIDIIKQDIEDKKLQMRGPGNYHEIHESLLLSHEKPSKDKSSPDERTLFNKTKLGKKFAVPKIKASSITGEVKLRGKVKDSKCDESGEMSLRHSWSPDSFRTGLDTSPTSPEFPAFHRHSVYNKRSSPKSAYPVREFQTLQEEEDLNITASSGNISQDTGYCSPTSQRRLPTTSMGTPMRDLVHRNNNSNNTDNSCNLCMDDLESSKLSDISNKALSQIQEFEDFIKIKLQLDN